MTISPVRDASSTPVVAGVAESLARLNDLTLDELRAEWRRLYRSAPPRLSRDLMKRAIAYTGKSVAHCVVSEPYVRAQANHDRVVHIRQTVIRVERLL